MISGCGCWLGGFSRGFDLRPFRRNQKRHRRVRTAAAAAFLSYARRIHAHNRGEYLRCIREAR
jgi:hypothetical protein